MPLRLLMSPLLFVIYFNKLDVNVVGMVSKFTEDTNIGSVVDWKEG